jgi:flagellar basal-body rod protein FlgG
MSNALQIAATGMLAQQLNLDTIANNLTNVNTAGFKKGRIGFVDLMLHGLKDASAIQSDLFDPLAGLPTARGAGVGVASLAKLFDAGELKKTDIPLDLAIRGDGFIELTRADGGTVFWRGGTLKVNVDGQLSTQAGLVLKPGISIPDNATTINVGADGIVQVTVPGQSSALEVGRLQLARFASPGQLEAQGDNLYLPTAGSGEATRSRPGDDGMGTLAQGYSEASNVKMVDEMVNLMMAQRAYEASLKVMQAADEMSAMTNNLRK